MSKSRKAKKADSLQVQEQVEVQEVTEDVVAPTIVEAGMEVVFPSQEPATEPTGEKPPSKPRVSKRPYIADVEALLSAGTHTKPEILAFILEKYPAVSKGGASTFLTDLLNEKYRHWKDRAVVKLADGKLQFADMVPVATEAHEAQPTGELGEKPAE